MKNKILLVTLLTFFFSYSQISVGPVHYGKAKKFNKSELEKFKKTETIFVLSSIYERDVYEEILKNSWTVTPYKVVDIEEFDIEDYLSDKYSIAQIKGSILEKQKGSGIVGTYLFTYFEINMYDSEKIFKRLDAMSPKKRNKKKKSIIDMYSSTFAFFYLFPKDEFIRTSLTSDLDKITISFFTEDIFYNYKPGLLKNYFQKINNLLADEEIYWMYKDDYLPELKKLAKEKLYIPSYMTIKYDPFRAQDSGENNESINKVLDSYNYQYEIISTDELSKKIMNNEEIYYFRYVRMNSEKFFQIVNSKTGEIIYRKYTSGFSYNLKPKHIKELNSKIAKALKK